MMNVTIFYPDGTSTTRPMTDDEIAQQTADEQLFTGNLWSNLRAERNARLSACDWTVLGDSPTPTAAWKAYRQALRDLPANTTDPTAPDWPTPPS
jgi:hypothetical protein